MAALNPAQADAVAYFGSPLLIVAGAGSGKTLVLTRKIVHLIQTHGFKPSEILAITFTNKAAKEMKSRVDGMLPDGDDRPYISTFHAWCGDILRQYFHRIGGPNHYIILDAADQKRLVKQLFKEHRIIDSQLTVQSFLAKIDRLKNRLVGYRQAMASPDAYGLQAVEAQLYEAYQLRLWRQNSIDFSDMIFFAVLLLKRCPEVLSTLQETFKYLLVDEYQDTNHAQYHLVQLLTGTRGHLTVVGDFDQNIYSWRGANIENILRFEKDFPGTKVILLTQNYRSTATILNAANALIEHNANRRKKDLWTENGVGDPLATYTACDEYDEAKFVVGQVKTLMDQSIPLDEMVVLFRINALSRVLEEQFTRENIGYRIVGGVRFFDRREVKDMLAYLRFIYNSNDWVAFSRIVNVPARGIGVATIEKVGAACRRANQSVADVIAGNVAELNSRLHAALTSFMAGIRVFRQGYDMATQDRIAQLIEVVFKQSGYLQMLQSENTPEANERIENVYELISMAREEELDLGEFLNKVALQTDLDQADSEGQAMTLMSMHNAKGLEYDYVFMIGLEEGILPHYRAFEDEAQLEEERRLCYVALTRARRKAVLTQTRRRTIFGDVRLQDGSRFLDEIPSDLKDPQQSATVASGPKMSFGPSADNAVASAGLSVSPGDLVRHSAWGVGKVVRLEGEADQTLGHIQFGGQIKKLSLKYAPLTRV